MDKTTFLDIDDSIGTKNLLLPDENRDALNQRMDELMKQFDRTPSILVQPIPGICIKTRSTNKEKVFVNICVTDVIPSPEDISDAKLYQLLNDEVPAYTIPMSIGAERTEVDKAGVPCATFDVVINSTYLKKCQKRKHFMAFTVLVVLSGVADKFDKKLDTENYVVLKNRTVMGKLQQHRIEKREPRKPQGRPLIEEMSHSTKRTDNEMYPQIRNIGKRDCIILRKPLKGPVERLIALFNMPKSVSIEDVEVLINSDRINVTDKKASDMYDVLLPYTLKANNAKAFFDRNISVRISTFSFFFFTLGYM
nr:PREDICTED: PIH1 domain-containing protein 1 isoform X1 [Linepithema humile]